jgi:hypothetical protein
MSEKLEPPPGLVPRIWSAFSDRLIEPTSRLTACSSSGLIV